MATPGGVCFACRLPLPLPLPLLLRPRLRSAVALPLANSRRLLVVPVPVHRHCATQVRGVRSVTVSCRSNGAVRLDILPPPSPSSSPTPSASSILLHLPPGPLLPDHARPHHNAQIAAALSAASGATLVTVNYRLAKDHHRYPTPVHDVLAAWDWVLQNLVDSSSSRLGVCGELLGANLATTLALTECHARGPAIAAVALNNPLVDWILPPDLVHRQGDGDAEDEEYADYAEDAEGCLDHLQDLANVSLTPAGRRRRRKQPSSWDTHAANPALPTAAVTRARAAFFHNQDGYFDPFASPVHFLRTPGLAFTAPPKSDDDLASQWDEDDSLTLRATVSPRRRSYRVYPPTGAGLRLPAMRVSAGEASPLRDQAEELVRLVQRSVRHDNDGSRDMALSRCAALSLRPGVGLWTGAHRTPVWRREIEAVGTWFRDVLARDSTGDGDGDGDGDGK